VALKNSIFQVLDANANAGIGIIIRRASEIAESKWLGDVVDVISVYASY